jgi:hypothetical protein
VSVPVQLFRALLTMQHTRILLRWLCISWTWQGLVQVNTCTT